MRDKEPVEAAEVVADTGWAPEAIVSVRTAVTRNSISFPFRVITITVQNAIRR